MDRSTPVFPTNRSLSEAYLFEFLPNEYRIPNTELAELYESFLTEYHGSPAFLNEKMSASNESFSRVYELRCEYNYYNPEKMDFWILGASHNNPLRIDAKNNVECGGYSCYEKSLKSGKICKPGILFFLAF